jgi:hypothetical protein
MSRISTHIRVYICKTYIPVIPNETKPEKAINVMRWLTGYRYVLMGRFDNITTNVVNIILKARREKTEKKKGNGRERGRCVSERKDCVYTYIIRNCLNFLKSSYLFSQVSDINS